MTNNYHIKRNLEPNVLFKMKQNVKSKKIQTESEGLQPCLTQFTRSTQRDNSQFKTHLDSIGDCQASVSRWDASMHDYNHQGCDADEGHADDVQPDSQPAHGTAEQVERSLVLVQQTLIPTWRKTDWLDTTLFPHSIKCSTQLHRKQNQGTDPHFTMVARLKRERKKSLPIDKRVCSQFQQLMYCSKMGNSHDVYRYHMSVKSVRMQRC